MSLTISLAVKDFSMRGVRGIVSRNIRLVARPLNVVKLIALSSDFNRIVPFHPHPADIMMISVVIPTYGRPTSALECIENILNSCYSEYEVLIVDQGPVRGLETELTARYKGMPNIRYFCLEPAGLSKARNLGLQQSRGDIVALIEDDVIVDPNWLEAIARTFKATVPRPVLIGGRILPIWPGPKPRWFPAEREFLFGVYDIGDEARPFPERDLPIGTNMAGLRKAIIDLGGFDEQLGPADSRKWGMLTGEDSMLGQRCRDAGHLIYYQPTAVVWHRIPASNLTPGYFLRRHFWEGVTVVTRLKLMGEGKTYRSVSIVLSHLCAMALAVARTAFPLKKAQRDRPLSAAFMLALAHMASSLGAAYAAIRLRSYQDTTLI
jgi:glycosyltransferase involved in cell wall biosynthesis